MRAHEATKDWDKALAECKYLLEKEPKSWRWLVVQADILSKSGDHKRAIAVCEKAIALAEDQPQPYSMRGSIARRAKNYAEAIGDFQRAIKADPDNFYAHNGLAWLYATCMDKKFRNGQKAVEDAKKACELSGWKAAFELDTYAAAHAEAGNFKEAVRWQREALVRLLATDYYHSRFVERLKLYESGQALFTDD